MLLSSSSMPAPADSPADASSPPAPPLLPLLSPLPSVDIPPLSSPPPPLAPTPAVSVHDFSPLPSPPMEQPPPPAPTLESPTLPSFPAKSLPPSPLSAVTLPPPLLSPPVETPSPPPPSHRRIPRSSLPLPPPANHPPPFSPESSPNIPFLPETSLPPSKPVSATPFSSSTAPPPKTSPAAKLPFFGPLGPVQGKPKGPLKTPLGPSIVPKRSPGSAAASPPALLPLVPKSLPETASYHRPSAGLLFGGVIVGVLLLVLLGLLFICYRATRKDRSEKVPKPPKGQDQEENVVPAGVQVTAAPPPLYAIPQHTSSVHYSTRTNGLGSGSVHISQAQTAAPPLNITVSSGTFTYDELSEATSGFSEANLLGQGGFGYVHKGILKNGREIAVKQLKIGSHQGEREFQAEVDTISRVHHKHLVSLVGYCVNGNRRLLVYEFVPNNTLEFHLHGNRTHVLEWETRLRIAVGAAKALAYLHEDCSPTIIHRDIKAANILLDSNFEAKVSDFGLAKFFSDTNTSVTHVSTRVIGTFGYMAPEYASSGKLTDKSDVYSFGVVLLELISGREPIIAKDSFTSKSLVDWARPLLAKALEVGDLELLVDPNLQGSYNKAQMACMAACASACIRQSAWLRPRMSQIVCALEGEDTLSKFDERVRLGQSTTSNSTEISNGDSQLYRTGIRRFNSGLTSKHASNGFSGSTSEYGISPSLSSSEHQVTG